MTDDTRRAEELYDSIRLPEKGRTIGNVQEIIAAALRAARDDALEEAVKVCWRHSDELADRDDLTSEQGMAQMCASSIRSLKSK